MGLMGAEHPRESGPKSNFNNILIVLSPLVTNINIL